MHFHSFRFFFSSRLFISILLLSIALSACGGDTGQNTTSQSNTTASGNAVITWPFDPTDGKWAIINGYRGNVDHAPGGSPNNYALFAFDFAKCLPSNIITSQGSEATCDLSNGWANTIGAAVYSPASGTVAWTQDSCHGLSMDIDGYSGNRIVLFHIDPLPGMSWSQKHFNQGDKIGTVSAGGCVGIGNHIHMALYSCTDCSSDPASQRVGHPFSGSWSISNTPFPDDGNTSNEYQGLLVPLQHVTAPTPPSTTIPAPVPTPVQPTQPTTQPTTPTSIPGIDPFVGTWGVSGINVLTINADGSATWQARGQNAQIQFTSVQGNTLHGTVTSGTVIPIAPPGVGNSIPMGSNITVTLEQGGVQISDGDMLCQPSNQCAY